jgi:hypothetical protein
VPAARAGPKRNPGNRAERLRRRAERRRVRRGAGKDAEHRSRGSKCPIHPASGALIAPSSTIAAASAFNFIPCCRSAAKKPGPSWRPIVKTKRISPKLLHEIERVMIHRVAEMPDENPSEEDARRAEPDAAELQTPERHPQHANAREHRDRMRDRLCFVEMFEPVHSSSCPAGDETICLLIRCEG